MFRLAGLVLLVMTTLVPAQSVTVTYDAGSAGSPAIAPDPTTQGWTLDIGTDPGLTVSDVSPDTGFGLNAWSVTDDTGGGGQFAGFERSNHRP